MKSLGTVQRVPGSVYTDSVVRARRSAFDKLRVAARAGALRAAGSGLGWPQAGLGGHKWGWVATAGPLGARSRSTLREGAARSAAGTVPARPPYPGYALPAMAAPEPPPPEGSRPLSALLSGIAQAAFHGNADITEELLRGQLYPEAPPEEFRALRAKMGGLLQTVTSDVLFSQTLFAISGSRVVFILF
ncbi:COMM domain-containing protein 1 isoform X2 [Corvus kubaryi]|uniref:COMM domain-containing protein 1 isoform X2 n=1 Tax=Corvus kubaryi TaxID=68294 RepID=UPI001C0403E5|nr:COMM domain-containing protein 1 isoform X2 [Corvus kubaryi]